MFILTFALLYVTGKVSFGCSWSACWVSFLHNFILFIWTLHWSIIAAMLYSLYATYCICCQMCNCWGWQGYSLRQESNYPDTKCNFINHLFSVLYLAAPLIIYLLFLTNALLVYLNLLLWNLAFVSLFFLDRISVIIIHYFFTGYKACRNGSCRCASRAVAETWTFNVWSFWKILKLQPLCYLWTMHNVCICFINFRYAPSSLQLIDG